MSDDLNDRPAPDVDDAEAKMKSISRRSFVWAGVATIGTIAAYRYLDTRETIGSLPWPLRRSLQANEAVAREFLSRQRLSPTFTQKEVTPNPRVNAYYGLDENDDLSKWTMSVQGLASGKVVRLTLAQIRAMPAFEQAVQLNCVEGWTQVMSWKGVRLIDFVRAYPPARTGKIDLDSNLKGLPEYVAMEAKDAVYYVGLDMESCLHPQSMLAYELNGQPLSWDHGAPVRLVMPIKYGYKQIKRVDAIRYTNDRPPDYWAELGYDWYGGF